MDSSFKFFLTYIYLPLGCSGSCRKVKASKAHNTSKHWKTLYPRFDNLKPIAFYHRARESNTFIIWLLLRITKLRPCKILILNNGGLHKPYYCNYVVFALLSAKYICMNCIQKSSKVFRPRQKRMGRINWKI